MVRAAVLRVLTALAAVVATAGLARAGDAVAVVRAGDSAPYLAVEAAFRKHVEARPGLTFVEPGAADVVFAVGSAAVDGAAAGVTPTVATLVVALPEPLPAHLTGVPLTHSVRTQLELLHTVLPKARRVGLLYDPARNQALAEEAALSAAQLDLELVPRPVSTPDDLPRALEWMANRVDVLWSVPDDLVYNAATAKTILLFSFRNRIPFVGVSESWVKAGALYAPVFDYDAVGAQCGAMALRLLDGSPVARNPPQHPSLAYAINTRSAEQLGVAVAPDVLRGARPHE